MNTIRVIKESRQCSACDLYEKQVNELLELNIKLLEQARDLQLKCNQALSDLEKIREMTKVN